MSFQRILTRMRKSVEFLASLIATLAVVGLSMWVPAVARGAVGDGGGSFLEAQSLMQSSKWAEAAIVLRSVLQERPRFLAAQMQLSSALVRLERRGEALTHLNRWISA